MKKNYDSGFLDNFILEYHNRYDRQLRLWGDHGQTALEKAKVCLIGAPATATEVLKSLVLPGVGRFTIVDGKKVTGEDMGNNFFLDKGRSAYRIYFIYGI